METFVRAEEGMSPTTDYGKEFSLKRTPEQHSVEYDVEAKTNGF